MSHGKLNVLARYRADRPGFEFLRARVYPERCFPETDGTLAVCLWNIWEQKKDPAQDDAEARTLNGMQVSLGELSEDVRYIRLQIACFERCYYTFPGNVDLILKGIASGTADVSQAISCEPPWGWIRRQLQPAHARHFSDDRTEQLRHYLVACQHWLYTGDLDTLQGETHEIAERAAAYLGGHTVVKELYLQMLIASLTFWIVPSNAEHEQRWRVLQDQLEMLRQRIAVEFAGQTDAVSKLIEGLNDGGPCHHSFLRRLEHILAHIGAGHAVEFMDKGAERRRIQEAITNYVHTLGCWVNGVDQAAAIAAWPPAQNTCRAVFAMLGTTTPLKRWLVGCLQKKLKDNQARHGRGAIDTEPQRFVLSLNLSKPRRANWE